MDLKFFRRVRGDLKRIGLSRMKPTPDAQMILDLYAKTLELFEAARRRKPALVEARDGIEGITLVKEAGWDEPIEIRHDESNGSCWTESYTGGRAAKVSLRPDGTVMFSLKSGDPSDGVACGHHLFFVNKPVRKWDGVWLDGRHQSQVSVPVDWHIRLAFRLVKEFFEKQFGNGAG